MEIKAEIGGTEYRVSTESLDITQQGGAVSTSNIDILVPVGATPPRALSSCVIYFDDVPVFGGDIASVSSPSFSTGKEARRFRLSINSWETRLNNRLVSEAFEGEFTHEIIQSLFDNYLAAEGFTLGAISTTTQQYDNYNCSYTKLYDIITELAQDINASFYITPDKKFYFVTRDAFTQIDAPTHITALQLEEEQGDLRTVQIVTGASEETSEQIVSTYWLDGQVAWSLGYAVSQIIGVTVGGVVVGVGKLGVDEEDTSKTFLYAVGSSELTLNANASVKPSVGQLCTCVFKGYYEIVVANTNDTLKSAIETLNGSSGIIEQILTDETINTFADADTKANALLDAYDDYEQEVSCECSDLANTELYLAWNISQPSLNISGVYVITERSISSWGHDAVWIRVKLKNKNYFSRYGTVLLTVDKKRGGDVKIYKQASISDDLTLSDGFVVDAGDLVCYPTSGAYADPLPGIDFYPGY